MSIKREEMMLFREEYLRDSASRGSWENDAEAIKIAVLMANNNGFTTYQTFPTNYEEHIFNLIIDYLTKLFGDSSVTFVLEEETGKRNIVIDWTL